MKTHKLNTLKVHQQLQKEFEDSLPDRLKYVEHMFSSFKQATKNQQENIFEKLYYEIHRLAGSGSSFGFDDLSVIAKKIEKLLAILNHETNSTGTLHDDHLEEKIQQEIALLNTAIQLKPSLIKYNLTSELPKSNHFKTEISDKPIQKYPLVYLLEDDSLLAQSLALQIQNFGYEVHIFKDTETTTEAVITKPPTVLIIDILFKSGVSSGTQFIESLQQHMDLSDISLIFISILDDFKSRISAVKCGACAYFTKPININSLIDRINLSTQNTKTAPYHIVIIDDDIILAKHYAYVLKKHGMLVSIIHQPEQVIEQLFEIEPDLVLMDYHMPSANGPQLASLIRQYDHFLSLPIVFLSTETDIEQQLSAMNTGGDDFLTKPIPDFQLYCAIMTRAKRGRELRSQLSRDTLTGVLTHGALKERVKIEIARAHRFNHPLCFAFIDIDYFKLVNDQHGHPFGDQVLRTLANLLQRRMRTIDAVGRYGGDELGILLPNCTGEDAHKILNQLTQDYSKITYQIKEVLTRSTISCGIAETNPTSTVDSLIKQADDALYQAKLAGRNQCVLAKNDSSPKNK